MMRSEADGSGREGPRTRRRLGLSGVEAIELDRDRDRDRLAVAFGRLFGDLCWAGAEACNSTSSRRFRFASK